MLRYDLIQSRHKGSWFINDFKCKLMKIMRDHCIIWIELFMVARRTSSKKPPKERPTMCRQSLINWTVKILKVDNFLLWSPNHFVCTECEITQASKTSYNKLCFPFWILLDLANALCADYALFSAIVVYETVATLDSSCVQFLAENKQWHWCPFLSSPLLTKEGLSWETCSAEKFPKTFQMGYVRPGNNTSLHSILTVHVDLLIICIISCWYSTSSK